MTAVPGVPTRRRSRWPLLLGVAAVSGVIAWLAFSGIGNALVYYQTPSELLARGEAAVGQAVRLGGLVKEDSVTGPATDLTFVLTDGSREVTVHSSVAPTSSFREGTGAVVEGELGADGVFEARLNPNADRAIDLFLALLEYLQPAVDVFVHDWRTGERWRGEGLANPDVRDAVARARQTLARWAGVDAALANGLLAVAGGILGRDLRHGPRTLEALGLASHSKDQMKQLLQQGRR